MAMSNDWSPKQPSNPSDPRILPASMQLTLVRHGDDLLIEWNVAEGVRVDGGNPPKQRPYVVRTLLSSADARMIAEQLLNAAKCAETNTGPGPSLAPPEGP